VTESRLAEVELRWHASPLTRALVTCSAVAMAAAVIGARWELVAFAAPLLGVLCSIGWQRPVPRARVHGEPGMHRCFESETAHVTVWAEADGEPMRLAVDVVAGMTLDTTEAAPHRHTVAVSADRWGRYPVRARLVVSGRGGLLEGTGVADAAEIFVFPMAPPQSTAIPRTELLGTSDPASSTPTCAAMCRATNCARSTGRSAPVGAACMSPSG
jgi:uncharacterized protein (DUF58 family)